MNESLKNKLQKKKLLYPAAIVVGLIIIGIVFYTSSQKQKEERPIVEVVPNIVVSSSEISTSTGEFIIKWRIPNFPEMPAVQTGLRYDFISHATVTPESVTYPEIIFPPEKDGSNFIAKGSFGEHKEVFFRVQVQPLYTEKFFWSEEQNLTFLE